MSLNPTWGARAVDLLVREVKIAQTFVKLFAQLERPLRPALGDGPRSWYGAGVGGLARPERASCAGAATRMEPEAAVSWRAPGTPDPGLPGPGPRPPGGTGHLQCHAFGRRPANLGGPRAVPNPGLRGNEMLMRRE